MNNTLHLTGSFNSGDTRLHSGHVFFGVEVWDTVNMAFSEISMVYNKYVTDIDDENLPVDFSLLQNFPNPFNPSTVIEYELAKGSDVKLEVFDILGRKCFTLVEQYQPVGKHRVSFDGLELAGGVYFYRLTADGFVQSRKMVLLK
ncbi:MAG: T9SS type A sorting domain-containing protein [Ignavibacteriales bacterium]|nr:T9SS type A sorting domain-containing protein [Ignavibacteriales bacterium]